MQVIDFKAIEVAFDQLIEPVVGRDAADGQSLHKLITLQHQVLHCESTGEASLELERTFKAAVGEEMRRYFGSQPAYPRTIEPNQSHAYGSKHEPSFPFPPSSRIWNGDIGNGFRFLQDASNLDSFIARVNR